MAINNTVILTGNLGGTPEEITEGVTKPFVAIRLATADSYKDSTTGEWKEKATVWHDVIAFGSKAREALLSLEKGARVTVTGGLSYRTYTATIAGREVEKKEARVIARKVELAPLTKAAAESE